MTGKKDELHLNGTTERFLRQFDKLRDDVVDMKSDLDTHLGKSEEVIKSHNTKFAVLHNRIDDTHKRIDGFGPWFIAILTSIVVLIASLIGGVVWLATWLGELAAGP